MTYTQCFIVVVGWILSTYLGMLIERAYQLRKAKLKQLKITQLAIDKWVSHYMRNVDREYERLTSR